MDPVYVFMLLFYWLSLSSVVFLLGAFTSRILITAPSGADVCFPAGKKECFGETAARYIFLISLFAFISNAVHFIFHCSVMTETPLNEVFSILPTFIAKTKYGRFTILRAVFLLAIIVISFITIKRDIKWAKIAGVVFSFFLILAISMSGHQGAKGYLNIPFFLDIVHFVAICLWIGGLFFIRICFSFFLKSAGAELWDIFKYLINSFSQMATISVFIAGATGLGLAYFNIHSLSQIISTQYGRVLLVKVFLVGFLFLLGGLNKFFIVPSLNSETAGWTKLTKLRKRLFLVITTEVSLGFIVLFITSLLIHLSPEG
jgi:putative copper resistance protein D